MKLIWNKEDMISYYQLKKNWKKSMRGLKIRSKLSKNDKIWENLIKNWYYMHFDPKKYKKI